MLKDQLVQREQKMLRISSNSHCTPLPCKDKTLSCSSNKVHIIDIVFDFLSIRVTSEELFNTLVITGSSDVPVEVTHGLTIPRSDLRTTHEEADLIIMQQCYGLTLMLDVMKFTIQAVTVFAVSMESAKKLLLR